MAGKKWAVDLRETIDLDGAAGHLRMRGTDEKNPVLLFLHGGPGVADRHWVLKHQSGLADACTLVCWDQRGAGLSHDRHCGDRLTLDRMVRDASLVVEHLRRKFNREKIHIVGHSWGSVLGVLLAQRHPEAIAAYVGMGQFAHGPENERLSYDFVMGEALRRRDRKAVADLVRIGEPVDGKYRTMKDMMVQRDYMTKYGGGEYKGKSSIWTSMVIPLVLSPEYRLRDLPRYARGAFSSLEQLWDEVVAQDFISSVPALSVPVVLTEGRHDRNTPVELAQQWFDGLEAPYKEWIWFEESAHSPIKEEPEAWGAAMREILKIT